MNEPFVSVIIPVYNMQPYLERCLDSVVNQTLANIEIIIINDGSTDGSLQISQQYQARYPNVILIDKENGGVSAARNEGLKIAKGEYIGFVDGDDYIELDMYETMYKEGTRHQADIVFCNYYIDNGDGIVKENSIGIPLKDKWLMNDQDRHEIMHKILGSDHRIWKYLWNKIFYNKMLKEKGITCNVNISSGDDVLNNLFAFYHAKKVIYINQSFNYYVERSGSISRRRNKDFYRRLANYAEIVDNFYKENNIPQDHTYILEEIRKEFFRIIYATNERNSISAKISLIRQLRNDPFIKERFGKVKTKNLDRRLKLFYFLFKYKLDFYHLGKYILSNLRKKVVLIIRPNV